MGRVEIYGHSDDLIEVKGSPSAEVYANLNTHTDISIGEWEVRGEYDGEWSFTVLDHPDGIMWEHLSVVEHAKEDDAKNEYSELLRIDVAGSPEVEKRD